MRGRCIQIALSQPISGIFNSVLLILDLLQVKERAVVRRECPDTWGGRSKGRVGEGKSRYLVVEERGEAVSTGRNYTADLNG